jgi:hypothetical protein
VIVRFDPAAVRAVQQIYTDPRLELLADRVEQVIADLEAGPPFPARVRSRRMMSPKLWYVLVYGSGERFALLWDEADNGDARIHWAGPEI